ncbi:MAG: UMP kinase [Crenarchaeota archaeon]|nr:UMP kinase [Thermoproteota archaeon]
METIVLKLGGSVLFEPSGELNSDIVSKWLSVLVDLTQHAKIIVVVGGGRPARKYISWGRNLHLNEYECDELGIQVSRLNAYLLLAALKHRVSNTQIRIYGSIPKSPIEVYEIKDDYDVIFVGGFIPGQSTVGVAAEVAELSGARVLAIGTDVNGIFDKDPKIYSDAKKFDLIMVDELINAFLRGSEFAGTYTLFDIQSLKLIKRSKLSVLVFNANNPEIAKNVILAFLRGNIEHVVKYASMIVV